MQKKKKVIVVCKTAKHRDGKRDREDEEKIYSEREKEKKKKGHTATHGSVRFCRTCFTHCTAEVMCVTVCVCVTRQTFSIVIYLPFISHLLLLSSA